MNKLRIAIVVPSTLPIPAVRGGAIETLVDDLIRENEKHHKLDITVYSNKDSQARKAAKKLSFTKVVYFREDSFLARIYSFFRNRNLIPQGRDGKFTSYYLWCIGRHIRKTSYDFVIIEGNYAACEQIKEQTKLPIILHLHNELNAQSCRAKETVQAVDAIFTVSNYIKERAETVSGANSGRIYTIHNCTDMSRFDRSLYTQNRICIRSGLGLSDSDVLLIFSGRLVAEKGILELVQAMKLLPSHIKLMILGATTFDDKRASPYMNKICECAAGLNGRIVLTGLIDHVKMPEYLAAADIAIAPSLWEEPAALTVFEAQAMELPLITTNSGGIPEYVNQNASVVLNKESKYFVEELAEAIQDISGNAAQRRQMAEGGRSYIERFDTANYYKEYCECLTLLQKELYQ